MKKVMFAVIAGTMALSSPSFATEKPVVSKVEKKIDEPGNTLIFICYLTKDCFPN